MTKVAILYHPRTSHEQNYRNYYIPYSIISIAAALKEYVPCILCDNNVYRRDDPAELSLPEPDSWGVVGVSVMIGRQIRDAIRFTEYVKRQSPRCPVVWGGPCATMLPRLVLAETPADFVAVGAGELTAVEFWRAVQGGDSLSGVAGLGFREADEQVVPPPRRLRSYDGLPPYRGCYREIDVRRYVRPDEHIGSRTVNYHSSQGCAFTCGFCCEPVLWGRRWVGMSAQRIMDDILPLVERYDVNGIKFYDSEFFIRLPRATEFASLVLAHGMSISWAAAIHPKNLMALSGDELRLLRKSGLSRLLIGAESAVDEELTFVGKEMDAALLRSAAVRCADAGVSASFTYVTGYPGFPLENIDRTLSFAEALVAISPRHEAKIHLYGPYPGTPLYRRAIDHGFAPPSTLHDWAEFDYYEVQTPWVPDDYFRKIRQFNESFYPYLFAGDANRGDPL